MSTSTPGLSEWLERQVEHFADTFRRQAYGPIVDGATVDDCLRITAAHNRKVRKVAALVQGALADLHVAPTAAPRSRA